MTDEPERTDDGRYLLIAGRRWRATDPAIPDRLRQQLVDELMAARRAVRVDGDAARARVRDAKIALGERGEPWWAQPSARGRAERLAAAARALSRSRGPGSTISPTELARVAGGDGWRAVLDEARVVLDGLGREKG